jgi:hypothetical protein
MKKNQSLWELHDQSSKRGYGSHKLTAEGAEFRAENAERSFLCAPLRTPPRPLRFKNDFGKHTSWIVRLFALTVVLFFCSPVVFSQSPSSITGHVTDPQGASIAGAEVRLRSRSGAQLLATTDDSGA